MLTTVSYSGALVEKVLDYLHELCMDTRDLGLCENCPMRNSCLEDTGECFNEYSENKSASIWQEFIDYGEHAGPTAAARKADYADHMRKMAIEERLIDEWNAEEGF